MKTLRGQVFLQILIPSVLLSIIVFTVSVYPVLQSSREILVQGKLNEFHHVADAADAWISSRASELLQISRALPYTLGREEAWKSYLASESMRLKFYFDEIRRIDEDGAHWTPSDTAIRIDWESILDAVKDQNRLFVHFAPVLDEEGANNWLIIVPVTQGGVSRGFISGAVKLEAFNQAIGSLTNRLFDSFSVISFYSPLDKGVVESVILSHRSFFKDEGEEAAVGRGVFEVSRLHGVMAYSGTLQNQWKLVCYSREDRLFEAIGKTMNLIIFLFALELLLILFIANGISDIISRPIRRLTASVHDMMEGRFTPHESISSNAEISSLENAFNLLRGNMELIRRDSRLALLGQLTAQMAHEIRKPLNIIHLAAQTLDESNLEKNAVLIREEVQNADAFVKEILGLTRPMELAIESFRPVDILRSVLEKYRLLSSAQGSEDRPWDVDLVDRTDGEEFLLDIMKMEQVFGNLIENALDAMDWRGKLHISLEREGGMLVIRIRDQGPGIGPSDADKVFDPYYSTKTKGTGLGLTICHQIVSAHNGTISLGNHSEGGAEAVVSIPGL